MIQTVGLSKSFGAQTLFDNLDWQVDRYKRTALTGANGMGKSTLLRILAGEIEADAGKVLKSGSLTLGYLPQEITQVPQGTALDIVLGARPEILRLEAELDIAQAKIESNPELAETYGELQHRYESIGGYGYRAEAKRIMARLGLDEKMLDKNVEAFSGGWQMRILLARLLLQRPELLLLDEPTNHLDLDSVTWLESFLSDYDGNVVIVSHDRTFLNKVVDAVANLTPEGLLLYPGNYDHFLEMKEALAEAQAKEVAQQKRTIAETQDFIERFRYKASKAKQVQSRIKALEKMEIVNVTQNRKAVKFRFPEAEKTPNIVLELKQVSKNYADLQVYKNLDFRIYRGDKIALIAPNGAGKSTLLKILADAIDFRGDRIVSDRTKIAHFAQHQVEALDFNKTLFDEASDDLPIQINKTMIRGALGAFLFTNDDMEKKVGVLSGGEKNKLALSKILLRAPNLLLLDEPTNHLDLDSRDALENALAAFTGSIVVISHDRYFIDAVCNKIVTVKDGSIDIFDGNYSQYSDFVALRETEEAEEKDSTSLNSKKQKRVDAAELRKKRKAATGNLEKRIAVLEADIEKIESELAEIEALFSDPDAYKNNAPQISEAAQRRAKLTALSEEKMDAWTEAQAELEEILRTSDLFRE